MLIEKNRFNSSQYLIVRDPLYYELEILSIEKKLNFYHIF